MALTNKAIPAHPARMTGGAINGSITHTITYPAASGTYYRGQLVTLHSTLGWCAAATQAQPAANTGMPVGIVSGNQTVAANGDPLHIYPALPEIVFRGTIVATTDTNGTFAQEDLNEMRVLLDVASSETVTGAVLIGVGTATTATLAAVRLVEPDHSTQPGGATSAVSTLSPWVCFRFCNSVWTEAAAVDSP